MVEVITQRAQRVASGAVGGSLGREDEGIWLRAASLVARARHGPVNRESAPVAVAVAVAVAIVVVAIVVVINVMSLWAVVCVGGYCVYCGLHTSGR